MLSPVQIARVCHEANRAYCVELGDLSQPSWDDAPSWQRDSAVAGVEAHLAEGVSPRESHALWCVKKLQDGWRYGPVKDPVLKQHPCLVPYDDLPRSQQMKDVLFTAVVKALALGEVPNAR